MALNGKVLGDLMRTAVDAAVASTPAAGTAQRQAVFRALGDAIVAHIMTEQDLQQAVGLLLARIRKLEARRDGLDAELSKALATNRAKLPSAATVTVTVASVSGVTVGAGVSGPGAGTGTIT